MKFQNFKTYLRAFEPEDYEISFSWRKKDKFWRNVIGPKYFVSSEFEKKWVEDAIFDQKSIKLAICLKDTHKHIGNVYLTDIDYINGTAECGIFIGDEDEKRKGYGYEATVLIIDFGFSERRLNRIYARTFEMNSNGMGSLGRSGFIKEGVQREEIFKDGKFLNTQMYSILAKEYFKNLVDGVYS